MSIATLFTKDNLVVGFWLFLNVASVVGCVAFNKMLYQPPHNFHYPSSLMAFHFLCTWTFVVLARRLSWFSSKRIETEKYVKLGAAQTGSVGFVNLSLLYNSVGMYQVLKFSNILVICAIEFFWKSKTYPMGIYLSLVTLVLGITIATVTNVELNTAGLLHGCLGSLSTAIYQIYNKSVQVESDVKPLQLLEYEQPYTALWAAIFALFTDDVRGLLTYQYTPTTVMLLLSSGLFAFGVNVTCYTIIGKTSPVTYGVVGHTKTVFIMCYGFFVLHERPGMKTFAGMLTAFAAIVGYTHLSTARAAAIAASSSKKDQLADGPETKVNLVSDGSSGDSATAACGSDAVPPADGSLGCCRHHHGHNSTTLIPVNCTNESSASTSVGTTPTDRDPPQHQRSSSVSAGHKRHQA